MLKASAIDSVECANENRKAIRLVSGRSWARRWRDWRWRLSGVISGVVVTTASTLAHLKVWVAAGTRKP
jgi:hypothetical protein